MAYNSALASTRRPEHELLLCCARTTLGSEHASRLCSLVQQKLDWEYLTDLTDRHGLLPLLSTHLKAQVADALPSSLQGRLQDRFQENQRAAMHLTGVLVRLLELFDSQGIAALAFKGPVLAEELYGNLVLRSFADLDLILPHCEIPRAVQLLLAHEFKPERVSAPHWNVGAMAAADEVAFRSHDGTALVELHSELMRHFPRRPAAAFFFDSSRSVSVAGREIRTLDPARLIVSLGVHGAKDFWASLKWVVDLAEFLRVHHKLDWSEVLRLAGELRSERMLRVGFLLAQGLLGVRLPDTLHRSCESDRQAAVLAAWARDRLLETGGDLSAKERFLFRVRTHPRYWGGVRYALRLAMTPAEEDRAFSSLPGPLPSLLRPFRLFRKYGVARRSAPRPQ